MEYYRAIDKKLVLTPKILYFLLGLQYYAGWNFRGLMFNHKFDFTKEQFGYLNGILLAITFFTGIVIAQIADKTQKPKTILIISMIVSSSIFALFFQTLIPHSYPLIVITYLLYLMTSNVLFPLLDRICLDYLKITLKLSHAVYGRQRLFATIAYTLSQYIGEAVIYGSGEEHFERVAILRVFVTMSLIPIIMTLIKIPKIPVVLRAADISIMKLLKETEYMFFLLIILLNGMTRTSLTIYLPFYQRQFLKLGDLSPHREQGFWGAIQWFFFGNPVATCAACGTLFEILLFFVAKNIIHKFGLLLPLFLAQVAQAVRFLAYAFIVPETPGRMYLCFAIELLKGVNFGLTHATAVQLALNLVPKELKSTSQIVYTGTFTGLGSFLGGLLGAMFKSSHLPERDLYRRFFLAGFGIICVDIGMFVGKYWVYDKYFKVDNTVEEEEEKGGEEEEEM